MISIYILIILALLGMGNAAYLIKKRREKQEPVCIKGKCNGVLDSKYNKTFGIYNDILGLVYYVFALLVYVSVFIPFFYEHTLAAIVSYVYYFALIVAFIMSVRFIFIMAFILKRWCQFCVLSAIIVTLMGLIAVSQFLPNIF